ncbi:exopolysaccharide synthesis protein [Trichococcus palustris]|uniref:non-specific protein-tyrosine kinase n=1 Tax=Trichococcus palustris TaxID=140314 RepID=A0A143YRW5_9LACT|nr:CpsD/CapB family tyrosine-protein kinase [Trichococcus palustris]CZQ97018.1 exopolysaccharide synthesis protein [Trichococcus palustris]SFK75151.1 capsular exopolysaccharide family [Trichococcus palustris]
MAKKQTKQPRKHHGLITVALPNAAVSEQFKTLRTNIQFSMVDKKMKSLVVISATPSAGKSTVAANLAVTFALQGNHVLIVDCDLRRPTVHRNFKLANGFGLTTLLTDQSGSVEDYLHDSDVEGLSVLTGGPVPPNPAELLSSNRMRQLEKELVERFDLVIYDTPPLLGFTDAQILASREDGTIFVIRHGVDTKEDIFKASESLKMVNANVLGVVYNHVPVTSKDHGYYYYGYHDEE